MTTDVCAPRTRVTSVTVLLAAFATAIAVRVEIAGPAGAVSRSAALAFAFMLAATAVVSRPTFHCDRAAATWGVVGGAVLVLPVGVSALARGWMDRPPGGFATWATLTVVVVCAEEAFLRGVLFEAVTVRRGPDVAVVVTALAFAALHVPLYGWHVVPLDVAVGLLLGGLRLAAGGWFAPAVAHATADLVGWWMV